MVTTIKHNMSTFNSVDNPLWGAMLEVNDATNGLWIYILLCSIYFIVVYVFLRKTNDIGKSLLSGLHVLMLLTVLLFYAGKMQGIEFVSEIFLLTILVGEAMGLAAIYYMRGNR